MEHNPSIRDVAAPPAALAWAAGAAGAPGRWLYDELSIAHARRRGEVVRRTEFDADAGCAWLRDVRGPAPLADVIRLATDVDRLRTTLLALAEDATEALSDSEQR